MDIRVGEKLKGMAVGHSQNSGYNTTCQTGDGDGGKIWESRNKQPCTRVIKGGS